jgi:hypothetical protein
MSELSQSEIEKLDSTNNKAGESSWPESPSLRFGEGTSNDNYLSETNAQSEKDDEKYRTFNYPQVRGQYSRSARGNL